MAAPNPISHGDFAPCLFVSGLFSVLSSDFAFFSSGFFSSGFLHCGRFTCGAFVSGFKSSADPETSTQARTSAAAHAILLMTFHPPGAAYRKRDKTHGVWPLWLGVILITGARLTLELAANSSPLAKPRRSHLDAAPFASREARVGLPAEGAASPPLGRCHARTYHPGTQGEDREGPLI
jgi:hypothetical protein